MTSLECKTAPAGNRGLTTTQSLRSCVMADPHFVTPSARAHPPADPVSLGDALADVMATLAAAREAGR